MHVGNISNGMVPDGHFDPVERPLLMTDCPRCGNEVTFDSGLEAGEIFDCAGCGAELEVVSLDPPSVEPAPEFQEDWGE